jgi:hypothetical protein
VAESCRDHASGGSKVEVNMPEDCAIARYGTKHRIGFQAMRCILSRLGGAQIHKLRSVADGRDDPLACHGRGTKHANPVPEPATSIWSTSWPMCGLSEIMTCRCSISIAYGREPHISGQSCCPRTANENRLIDLGARAQIGLDMWQKTGQTA